MTQSKQAKQELAELLEAKANYLKYNKVETMFPDDGKYARHLYPKQLEFFAAGAAHSERAFIAGNRLGKTNAMAFEVTSHVTGRYPDWWTGHRFDRTNAWWVAGVSHESVIEILQTALLGEKSDLGSGMIPKHLIEMESITSKAGVPGGIGHVYIKHVSGGLSKVTFKAYSEGSSKFQGADKNIALDEEPPVGSGIYEESKMRTAGDEGEERIMLSTFTPLFGQSEVVLGFLKDGVMPLNGIHPDQPWKHVTQASWDDVPHLSEQWKTEALAACSPHLREARSRGVPSLGSGAIYPYFEEDYVVDPIEIPFWWPRFYGLDTGWNKTAAVWFAMDPDTNIYYGYSEYYVGHVSPIIHAAAIKARGDWIIGAIDPAAEKNVNQDDGREVLTQFLEEGLNLEKANNAIEAGLMITQKMFDTNRIKIFSTMANFLSEIRSYHRDKDGKIVKRNDHLMDAMRYAFITGRDYAMTKPDEDDDLDSGHNSGQGRNQITGY